MDKQLFGRQFTLHNFQRRRDCQQPLSKICLGYTSGEFPSTYQILTELDNINLRYCDSSLMVQSSIEAVPRA